jgi:hypothetical protein
MVLTKATAKKEAALRLPLDSSIVNALVLD